MRTCPGPDVERWRRGKTTAHDTTQHPERPPYESVFAKALYLTVVMHIGRMHRIDTLSLLSTSLTFQSSE